MSERNIPSIEEINAHFAQLAAKDALALARSPGEHLSSNHMRCPACGWRDDPSSADLCELYSEGVHDVDCQRCNHSFVVETAVSYTFISPPALEVARG